MYFKLGLRCRNEKKTNASLILEACDFRLSYFCGLYHVNFVNNCLPDFSSNLTILTLCSKFCISPGKCIALRFINSVGHPFKLISAMKPEGWLVTGEEFRIRLTFKDPNLHKFVTFRGEDPYGQYILHLDGDKTISVMPRTDCSDYIDVQVTGIPGEL